MRTQVFGVHHFQPGARHVLQHGADVHQFAAGENILFNEVTHAGTELPVFQPAGRDAVVHHQSTGCQQAHDFAEVGVHVGMTHMLKHADRRDFVEGPLFAHVAVVAQLDAHALAQAFLVNQPLHMGVLVF